MNLQKINWKINFKNPKDVAVLDFVKVFNKWIPQSPEIFIDVADYKHVPDGPWILLAGYHADFALDNADYKLGFLMNQKSSLEGDNKHKLVKSFGDYIKRCQSLLTDEVMQGKLKLDLSCLELIINDRGLVPNNQESFAALSVELNEFADRILGGATLTHHDEKRRRFTVTFKPKNELTVEGLLKKVS